MAYVILVFFETPTLPHPQEGGEDLKPCLFIPPNPKHTHRRGEPPTGEGGGLDQGVVGEGQQACDHIWGCRVLGFGQMANGLYRGIWDHPGICGDVYGSGFGVHDLAVKVVYNCNWSIATTWRSHVGGSVRFVSFRVPEAL